MIKFPGIHHNLPMNEYHEGVDALSRSDIVRLLRSPLHYKEYMSPETVPAHFLVGSALHGLVLENIEPVVNPFDGRAKKGKEWQAEHPESISVKDAVLVKGMAEQAKPFFLGDSDKCAEISYFWEEGTVRCKCRPDWIVDGVIYDLKSTRRDARNFYYDVRDYSLDLQAAWYLRGVGQFEPVYAFRFVVVEKEPPHGVMVYEVEDLEPARIRIVQALELFGQCVADSTWPGYSSERTWVK